MSMSTAAQRQLVAPHGAAESLAGLWILKGSVTAAQVDDGAKIDISRNTHGWCGNEIVDTSLRTPPRVVWTTINMKN
jgi:hypothetical protein